MMWAMSLWAAVIVAFCKASSNVSVRSLASASTIAWKLVSLDQTPIVFGVTPTAWATSRWVMVAVLMRAAARFLSSAKATWL